MRIALDAMGGDHAPRETVRGAVEAANGVPGLTSVILVGDETAIRYELRSCRRVSDKIEICHASEVVEMHESPVQAVRRKRDSSIGRAVDMVREGKADAVVSAGNTGAVMVAASLKLRPLEGVERPAITAVMPTMDRPLVMLDAGANTDCTGKMLLQFAVMGSVYSQYIFHRSDPSVGLLNIGTEEMKGNELTKQAFALLSKSGLNFVGNVESRALYDGKIDVVVCDGFVGNVLLKTAEGVAKMIGLGMKQEFKKNPVRVAAAMLMRKGLKAIKRRFDPEVYGGAPLLGIGGICIKAHGGSHHTAIFHAIRVASESVHHHIDREIVRRINALEAVPK